MVDTIAVPDIQRELALSFLERGKCSRRYKGNMYYLASELF
jgi:hypothetical protein